MTSAPYFYVLCSNPRSGTTLLCDMLSQTGMAGNPNSFFRQKSLQDWCDDWNVGRPVDPEDADFTKRYFTAMLAEGRGETPVFGLRLMGPDLRLACDWLALAYPDQKSEAATFEAAFGPVRFIHLSRSDKLAEAVSYIRAEQTGLWHQRPDGSALEQLEPTAPSGYDADAITTRMTELARFDTAWDDWFAAEAITPLRITYETLAENPQHVLAEVLSFIGQDPASASSIVPGVRKLADATNTAWMARYRERFPDR